MMPSARKPLIGNEYPSCKRSLSYFGQHENCRNPLPSSLSYFSTCLQLFTFCAFDIFINRCINDFTVITCSFGKIRRKVKMQLMFQIALNGQSICFVLFLEHNILITGWTIMDRLLICDFQSLANVECGYMDFQKNDNYHNYHNTEQQ